MEWFFRWSSHPKNDTNDDEDFVEVKDEQLDSAIQGPIVEQPTIQETSEIRTDETEKNINVDVLIPSTLVIVDSKPYLIVKNPDRVQEKLNSIIEKLIELNNKNNDNTSYYIKNGKSYYIYQKSNHPFWHDTLVHTIGCQNIRSLEN